MITAKIIGAGGYGGVGILELLLSHPEVEVKTLISPGSTGENIAVLHPHLDGFCNMDIIDAETPEAQEPRDVVFMSTPDRVGMKLAQAELDKGAKVIDFSGDFRFNSVDSYAEYARRLDKETSHDSPGLLPESVYGLPELHRDELQGSNLAGNPGCFAVSCILGLAPAAKANIIDLKGIICDCKTGVSGAGKTPNPLHHYPNRYENMNAYRLTGHQHVCEVERELGLLANTEVTLTFTAQVLPICRGIMSTLYGRVAPGVTEEKVLELYRDFYKNEPFVRVYDKNKTIGSHHVRCTNFCNLTVSVDERTGILRVVSYIDNLMKGQAGAAMQNMNVLFGFEETAGLDRSGMQP
ncbi:MAG: N-acetyl-gamma-glutamyl-phosphate reductase [Kiritimatiellae bacterium]|jgi:N-acetyl-gamma-glutamyl-phosphate reductase|nr:N-acetyl-gamma-glutamyl-phosphate reductase [Kiritimatiellia bacterium]